MAKPSKANDNQTASAEPLSAREFDQLLAECGPLPAGARLAVGLSGGGDSSALTALLKQWAEANGATLTALIIDHKLRPGSDREAQATADYWRGQGLVVEVLTHDQAIPSSGIEEFARNIRWSLMTDWCAANDVTFLAIAHHAEDQAETLLMRLAKGSGVLGLAGMSARQGRHDGLTVIRPLLTVPRARLRAVCLQAGVPIVEDLANRDPRFQRTQLRDAADLLAGLGLAPDALGKTAARQREVAELIDQLVSDAAAQTLQLDFDGAARLDRSVWMTLESPLVRRELLARAISAVGGREYPLPVEAAEGLAERLMLEQSDGETLGGCLIQPEGEDRLLLFRETAGIDLEPVAAHAKFIWDRRFLVAAPDGIAGVSVVPADQDIWRRIKTGLPALYQLFEDCPARLRWSLPAAVSDGHILGVLAPSKLADQPALAGWTVKFAPQRAFPGNRA
ncbi:MAG: tRNA lysidine(34) synthetase TilS [Pseudomonadota bacterium]